MEDDLIFFSQMEDNLFLCENGRQLQPLELEDNLNGLENTKRPQYLSNWEATSLFWKIKDDLNYLENGNQPQSSINRR